MAGKPRKRLDPTTFGSRESLSVELIHDHYRELHIIQGMTAERAVSIATQLGLGIYEMGALAACYHAEFGVRRKPSSALVDRYLKDGLFPPPVALHFLMYEDSIRMMNGEEPKLINPIYLVDKAREHEAAQADKASAKVTLP